MRSGRVLPSAFAALLAASVAAAAPAPEWDRLDQAARPANLGTGRAFDGSAPAPAAPEVPAGAGRPAASGSPAGAKSPDRPEALDRLKSRPRGPNDIDLEWLSAAAQDLLDKNKVTEVRHWKGRPERECTYHAPSLPFNVNPDKQYPHQWMWDSLAHAITLSYLKPDEAKEEVRSLLYAQREDGFIPHTIWNKKRMRIWDPIGVRLYPSKDHSAFTQPPLVAETVEQIYKTTGDLAFVREVWPSLQKYYGWLERTRQGVAGGPDDGLCEIIGSDESGMDNGPEYDRLYRTWFGLRPMNLLKIKYKLKGWDDAHVFGSNYFRVKDLLFNSVFATNLHSMAALADALGDAGEAARWRALAQETESGIEAKMWDAKAGVFRSLDARHNRDAMLDDRVAVSALMPLTLDDIPEDRVEAIVNGLLADPKAFWARFPIPSEPRSFYAGRKPEHGIWRGSQTWIYPVRYVVKGLLKQADRFPQHAARYRALAQQLTCRSYELVRKHGFHEYYDAETGKPDGAPNFGWSTLVLDMVHSVGDLSCPAEP